MSHSNEAREVAEIIWSAGLFGVDLSVVHHNDVLDLAEEIITHLKQSAEEAS